MLVAQCQTDRSSRPGGRPSRLDCPTAGGRRRKRQERRRGPGGWGENVRVWRSSASSAPAGVTARREQEGRRGRARGDTPGIRGCGDARDCRPGLTEMQAKSGGVSRCQDRSGGVWRGVGKQPGQFRLASPGIASPGTGVRWLGRVGVTEDAALAALGDCHRPVPRCKEKGAASGKFLWAPGPCDSGDVGAGNDAARPG
jgi:hypothetical protein